MIISPYGAFLRIIVDPDSCRLVSSRAAPVRCRFKALDVEGLRLTPAFATSYGVACSRRYNDDSWLRSCARHRTREHCALSAMLTVSQLSKSFAGRALFDDVFYFFPRSEADAVLSFSA
jgi:hypothetical protein